VTARLPRPFRWLWAGFGSANLADGVLLAAGPLLVTSITTAPAAVAGAALAQRLPWLLFGLLAGEVVDRTDRRRLMIIGHVVRALLLGVLVAAVVGGQLTLTLVYAVLFLLGTAETFADNAGSTLVAAIVPSRQLGVANSRLVGTRIVSNQLAGPPLGAFLFAVGLAVPFTVEAALLGLAAVCIAQLPADTSVMTPAPGESLRRRLLAGARWLRGNAPVRRLAIVIALFNVTFGATYAILVLYALERLGLDEAGFGLLLSASAAGGLVGAAFFERLEARFSYTTLLRTGLVVESATHLLLGATTSVWVAATVLVAFGVHEATWGSLSNTIRLRATPTELQGRVNGIYLLAVFGPMSLGAVLGGVIAESFGLLAVFWVGGAGAAVTTVWAWRGLADLSRYDPESRAVGTP
jgi:MFS family permease